MNTHTKYTLLLYEQAVIDNFGNMKYVIKEGTRTIYYSKILSLVMQS